MKLLRFPADHKKGKPKSHRDLNNSFGKSDANAVNIYHSQLWLSKCIVGEICQDQTPVQGAKPRAWIQATERKLPACHL